MKEEGWIQVTGARVHNLKNVDVQIPRGKLTVFTGLSGSGKSSLAFDTIFAEGQRRYIDTFSAYARGYLNNMRRPEVDKITGLSPVISIDQKTTSHNPRSTVGTITEVYDYLRLLFARAGIAYSYNTGEEMVHYTDEQITDIILHDYAGERIYILAPLVNNRKGHYKELFEQTRKKGFVYVRVDGEIQELTQGMRVDRYKNHTIEVVVDRIVVGEEGQRAEEDSIREELQKRILDSVSHAMQLGGGLCMVTRKGDNALHYFSRSLMCPTTGIAYAEPAPHSFSFNTPQGWCPCCRGLGIVPTDKRSDEDLPDEESVIAWLEGKISDPNKPAENENSEEPSDMQECPECHGQRLRRESLMFRIGDKNIAELASMDLTELRTYLKNVQLNARQQRIAEEILKEIDKRLAFMEAVGLQYLNLNRPSDSLSGGEAQRIRLATQIGSRLVNVLYILDEPSIGLHQRDNERLINSLKELRDLGNTIIVVEHDEQMMRSADWIVDIGPKAGRLGGKILFSGTPEEMLQTDTLTADYPRQRRRAGAAGLPRQQSEGRDRRNPSGHSDGSDRRLGLRQIDPHQQDALPHPLAAVLSFVAPTHALRQMFRTHGGRRGGGLRQVHRQSGGGGPVAYRAYSAQQSRHLYRRLCRHTRPVCRTARVEDTRLETGAFLLQHQRRTLRRMCRKRLQDHRDAFPA